MKKVLILIFLAALLYGCATSQPMQKTTLGMNHEGKIQYYKEQINRYQYLLDQEQKKPDK